MPCLVPQAGQRILNPLFFAGLIQWYCAERITTPGAPNAIDLSGSGRTGNNGASVPIVPGVVNGRPVWRFSTPLTFLTYNPIVTAAGPNFSAFVVAKVPNLASAPNLICWINGAATNQVIVANAAANIACYDGANHPTSNVIDDFTNFSMLGVVCAGGSCTFFQNANNIGAPAPILTPLTLTGFGGTGVFGTALDMAECVFYNTNLTADQVTIITEYFRERYALF